MNLGWHYELRGDENDTIDAMASRSEGTDGCTPYNPTTESGAGHPAHASTCTGWVPVGRTSRAKFTGHLNGAGNRITNLYAKASDRSGLFGYTNGATIQNLGLSAVNIRGANHAGALVGDMQVGSVANSYASGSVTASASRARVGGLVGTNERGSISNSYATGSVMLTTSASNSVIGGLVGNNAGSISNSYATASVTAGAGATAGGLVGENKSSIFTGAFTPTISNSYATGRVTTG